MATAGIDPAGFPPEFIAALRLLADAERWATGKRPDKPDETA